MSRPALRRGALQLLLLFGLSTVAGCMSGPGDPWHVPKGREGRFREANRVCHQLTDNDDGTAHRERFDGCMERRGWRRQRFTDRLGFGW